MRNPLPLMVPFLLLVCLSLPRPASALPVELRFQTADAANLLWMIDQMSQWDPRATASSYRAYWSRKIGLDEEDLDMLDRYARVRRRISRGGEKPAGSRLALLGGGDTTPGEQYFIAFLEIPRLSTALGTLPYDAKDKETIVAVLKHFGKKIGTQGEWSKETAHLKSFEVQAGVLASLADPSGFLTQVKDFLGVTEMPAQITVDALWAPPGATDVRPAIVGFHIILPLPAESVASDEAVVKQMAVAVGETVRYMVGRLPDSQRRDISQRLLSRSGLVNVDAPRLLLDALATALGQALFLRDRFPDLPTDTTYFPFDPSLPYPYAVDELARSLVPDLRAFLPAPGAFGSAFLDKAIQRMDQLFPPSFRSLASCMVVLGSALPAGLFRSTFSGPFQDVFELNQVDLFVAALKDTRRASAILVRPKETGPMNLAMKQLGVKPKDMPNLRPYQNKSVIYPVEPGAGYGPMFVVVAQTDDDFRRAMVDLHRLPALPQKPMLVSTGEAR